MLIIFCILKQFFFYWKRKLFIFEKDKIATENNKTVNNFKVDYRYGTKVWEGTQI